MTVSSCPEDDDDHYDGDDMMTMMIMMVMIVMMMIMKMSDCHLFHKFAQYVVRYMCELLELYNMSHFYQLASVCPQFVSVVGRE